MLHWYQDKEIPMRETSLVKRIPKRQAVVLDFIAKIKEQDFAVVAKNVIDNSPLFAEFKKQYELSANDG